MSTEPRSSKPYTPREVAFIIGYADYCIHYKENYTATVAIELGKATARPLTWLSVRSKLSSILKSYNSVDKSSVKAFITQGIDYIDIDAIPSDIRTQLDNILEDWGLSIHGAEAIVPEPSAPVIIGEGSSSSDNTESFSTEQQLVLNSGTDHRTRARRVLETPQLHGQDDAAYPMTGPSFSLISPISPIPTPVLPAKQTDEKRRSATPTDPSDLDYVPPLERNRSTRSSSRAPVARRGVTVLETNKATKTCRSAKPEKQIANSNDGVMASGIQPSTRQKSTEDPSRGPRARRGVAVPKTNKLAITYHAAQPEEPIANTNDTAMTSEPERSSRAAGHARGISVIDLDDVPEHAQVVASSSQALTMTEAAATSNGNVIPPAQHATEPSCRAAGKRRVIEESEDETTSRQTPPKRQKTSETTLESLQEQVESQKVKIDALLEMLSSMVSRQQDLSEESSEHMYQLIRTLRDPKGSIIENLIKDLESQRALKAKHRDLVQKLVEFVNLNDGTVFPKTPPQQEVNETWTAFYEHIVYTVGPNHTSPKPKPESAGYLTCTAENIANGRITDAELQPCIASLGQYLKSPHAQQTLLSALFCRWVFASPEPMLHSMHSPLLSQLYTAIHSAARTSAAGLLQVAHHDKTATRLLFADPDFQRTHTAHRASSLASRLEAARASLCTASRIPCSMSPSAFAARAIAFKQALLLSPRAYTVHFARPGCAFDARWMQAVGATHEAVGDAQAEGGTVRMCVFPALVAREAREARGDGGVERVLCVNKVFFPGFGEVAAWEGGGAKEAQGSKAVVFVVCE
ncbi:hypothetical protein EJ07DRAFT_173825 [Lizonia empirigonia]|nr:hypothetical protein EJ07DRAFT_173825 [Lizonia empirigonia]